MINSILEYFKTDRTWDSGVKLYTQHGRNRAFLHKINLQGKTDANINMLYYQLWKLTGKHEFELNKVLSETIIQQPEKTEIDEVPEKPPEKPKTVQEATRIKLREKFPFLSASTCPDTFKILVADMLTAHDNFIKAHNELYNITHSEEAFGVADVLMDNYLNNREIWDELEYYKTHGKILGKHYHFEAEKRREKLIKMTIPDLIKLRANLEMNIWRNKKKLTDDKRPDLVSGRKKRIAIYESDFNVVNGLLNLNG